MTTEHFKTWRAWVNTMTREETGFTFTNKIIKKDGTVLDTDENTLLHFYVRKQGKPNRLGQKDISFTPRRGYIAFPHNGPGQYFQDRRTSSLFKYRMNITKYDGIDVKVRQSTITAFFRQLGKDAVKLLKATKLEQGHEGFGKMFNSNTPMLTLHDWMCHKGGVNAIKAHKAYILQPEHEGYGKMFCDGVTPIVTRHDWMCHKGGSMTFQDFHAMWVQEYLGKKKDT